MSRRYKCLKEGGRRKERNYWNKASSSLERITSLIISITLKGSEVAELECWEEKKRNWRRSEETLFEFGLGSKWLFRWWVNIILVI